CMFPTLAAIVPSLSTFFSNVSLVEIVAAIIAGYGMVAFSKVEMNELDIGHFRVCIGGFHAIYLRSGRAHLLGEVACVGDLSKKRIVGNPGYFQRNFGIIGAQCLSHCIDRQ